MSEPAHDYNSILSELFITHFDCEKEDEPDCLYKMTDGEGTFRFECEACGALLLIHSLKKLKEA